METGSLLFCPDCGTLLNLPKDDEINVECEQCKYVEPATCKSPTLQRNLFKHSLYKTAYENLEIITRSHPDAFPSALHQKKKTQTKVHEGETLLKVTTSQSTLANLTDFGVWRWLKNVQTADIWKHTRKRCRCAVLRCIYQSEWQLTYQPNQQM